ncbi:hypothetical protein [Pengzhenrongella sp.]|jgi:hypothetical protein|uniref:hypothetical protein n=1 Tax=Pengzhenrongella sp. TaxID=2888820 RepID=UPI002F92EEA6
MTTETTRSRQPTGAPSGGQFAAETKTEPDLALAPPLPGTPEQRAVIADLTYALACGLDLAPDGVTVEAVESQGCGSVAGAVELYLTAPLADDRHTEVTFGVRVHENGYTRDSRLRATYDIAAYSEDVGFDRDGVAATWGYTEEATAENVRARAAEVLDQAHLQRGVEDLINRPQREANLAERKENRRGNGFSDILSVEVTRGGQHPTLRVKDQRSNDEQPVDLTLDRATGTVTSGHLSSRYGTVALDGDNLARVVGQIDRQIGFELDGYGHPAAEATKERFELRLRLVFTK